MVLAIEIDSLPGELWNPIPSTRGHYEASTLGRVRRAKSGHGTFIARIRKCHINAKGYFSVTLSVESKVCTRPVHSLIAEAFWGDRPLGFSVNHIDGQKLNNRPENLEYVTHQENMRHAKINRLVASGDKCAARKHPERCSRGPQHSLFTQMASMLGRGNTKLTPSDVKIIRQLRLIEKRTLREIAEKFGVSIPTIARATNGACWKLVPFKV